MRIWLKWISICIVMGVTLQTAVPQDTNWDAAQKYLREQTYHSAAEQFKAFSDKNPKDPRALEARYWIGYCYHKLNKYPEAEKALQEVIDSNDPGLWAPRAQRMLVLTYQQWNRWQKREEIKKLFEAAIGGYLGQKQLSADDRRELAQLYFDAARWFKENYYYYEDHQKRNRAGEWYQAILDLKVDDDTSAQALFEWAMLYMQGYRQPDEKDRTLELLKRVIADYPKSAVADDAQYQMGQYLESNKQDYLAAIEAYDAVTKNYGDSKWVNDSKRRIAEIRKPSLSLATNPTWMPGERAIFSVNARNVSQVTVALFPVDVVEQFRKLRSPTDVQKLTPSGSPVHTWDVDTADKGDHQWHSLKTEAPKLTAGVYFARANAKDKAQSATGLINVSSLVMIANVDSAKSLLYLADRATLAPVEGALVVGNIGPNNKREHRVFMEGKTDANGLLQATHPNQEGGYDTRLAFVAQKGAQHAWVDTYRSSYDSQEKAVIRGYVYTDRPVYRPEQSVKYKAILRSQSKGDFENLPSEKVELKITDPQGKQVVEQSLSTDAFGTINGDYALPEKPTLGVYRIQLKCKDQYQSGAFRVEEYKKPEFKVAVKPPTEVVRPGDEATARVQVDYYFGAPVPNAKVEYTVYRNYYSPYYWWGWGRYDWFLSGEEFSPRPHYGGQTVVTTGTAETDAQGAADIVFETLDDSDQIKERPYGNDYRYSIHVKATDQSRRVIEGSGSLIVTHTSFYLYLHTPQYLYDVKDKVTVKVKAETPNGEPVQTAAKMTLYKLTPIYEEVQVGDRKEKRFKDYAREKFWTDDKPVKTYKAGSAEYVFQPDMEGCFEIEAEASDEVMDKKVLGSTRFHVASDRCKGANYDYANLELITEKSIYEKGETIRMLINSPVRDASVLLLYGAREIYSHQVIKLDGNAKVIEIPVTDQCVPNFFINAQVVGRDKVLFQQKAISVPPVDEILTVKIESDKKEYQPRSKGQFVVRTLDHKGKPVPAQVSLGVTDESVYYIQGEMAQPIEKFFYSQRLYWGVRTQASLEYWDRYADRESKAMQRAGGAGGLSAMPPSSLMAVSGRAVAEDSSADKNGAEGGLVEPTVREFFPDTCFWGPTIVTDEDGTAEVTVDFPDSLTTWRATARGITTDTRVGQQVESVVTKKNIIVRLEAPRFFVQRDEVTLSAIVHNYTAQTQQVVVDFNIDGLTLLEKPKVTVGVPANGEIRVDRRVKVETPGKATIVVSALTKVESDAVKKVFPVLPHGAEKFAYVTGKVAKGDTQVLNLPAERVKEGDKLTVYVTPSIAATLLDSLEYLAQYPYGCVEQTMSRFIPTVYVARVMKDLGIRNAKLEKQLPDMVEKGLNRIYGIQHGDGGWGWWSGGDSDYWMSAYVVFGLQEAKRSGFDVREDALNRGIRFVKENLKEVEDQPDSLAYASYVLSMSGQQDAKWVDHVYKQRDDLNEYTRALLTLTLKNMKDDRCEIVLRNLEGYVIETENGAHWGKDAWGWRWSKDQVETTAFCLKAMLAVNPSHRLVDKTVQWLALNRRGAHWKSTRDTAAAIYALAEYMKVAKETTPNYTVDVIVNGKLVKTLKATPENALSFDGKVEVPTSLLKTGKNEIALKKNGDGPLYYAADLQYYTLEEPITAASHILSVDRKYLRVVREIDKDGRETEKKLPISGSLKSGDEIEVELTINSENSLGYIAFEDMKPSGCEPVELRSGYDWSGVYSHRELRDEMVTFFISHLPQGKHVITYRLRAEIPGDFHVMPHRGWSMYVPEVRCISDEARMQVVD